jgi:diacylglycerol O-acyltransferase / wax synthase
MSRARRLSALDASFLAMESPTAHMHVGWVAVCSAPQAGPAPSFSELRDHIELRLARAPRYRQKLAEVPLGLRAPEWIDDERFSIERHVYRAAGPLGELVDEVMSVPLRRDRPLWEMWVCEHAGEGGFALVCKAHHCMVDGIAAVELGSLLFDCTPEGAVGEADHWHASPRPSGEWLLARGLWELLGEHVSLLYRPLRAVASPGHAVRQSLASTMRLTRALSHSLDAAPASALNAPLSPRRRVAWTERPLADLRVIRRTYGTSLNDVMLAAVAGAIRSYLMRRGEEPTALKVMIPVNVRSPNDVLGNHISFVFAQLPCDQPDPVSRLYTVHAAMSARKRNGEAEGADLALKVAAHTPLTVQHAVSRLVASPRVFNLVVSNIPGPGAPLYMRGCPLHAAYPVVPLAEHHAVSVGMTTIRERAWFCVHADAEAVPDAETLAHELDGAITELLARTRRTERSLASLESIRATVDNGGRPARARPQAASAAEPQAAYAV